MSADLRHTSDTSLGEWQELARKLRGSLGFSLCFVFTDSPDQVERGREQLRGAFKWQPTPALELVPETAPQLVPEALDVLIGARAARGRAVWLECWQHADDEQWQAARAELLAQLSRVRSQLERSFSAPLILILPGVWAHTVAETASDLWSLRRFGLRLEPSRPPSLMPLHDANEALDSARACLDAGDTAGALADAERALEVFHAHGATRSLDAAEAWHLRASVVGDPHRAIADATEAVTIRRDQPGGSHALLSHSLRLRASHWASLGEYDKCQPDLKEAIDMLERAGPEEHLNLMACLVTLGDVSNQLGEYDAAERLFNRVVHDLSEARLESEEAARWVNATGALALRGLARTKYLLGAQTEAREIAANALTWAKAAYGSSHPFVEHVSRWMDPVFYPMRPTSE